MLAETICKAQKGDEKSTLELLTLFNRLMTRYAYLLEYEEMLSLKNILNQYWPNV